MKAFGVQALLSSHCSFRSTRRGLRVNHWSGCKNFLYYQRVKFKHEKGSEIVDAINEMHSIHMQVELSTHKLDLVQQQQARKAQEEQYKERAEEPKEKEEEH